MFRMTTKEAAQKAHNDLIEAVADVDDGIMDKYLEGEEISNAELKAAIRKATINGILPSFGWFCFQEQGCSDVVGCCDRLLAITT